MSLGKAYLMKELFAHHLSPYSRAKRANLFHVSTHSPTTPVGASLFLQLWLGSCCTTPSACTAQSQPDCGALPASEHSGLSHEDGASEQPSGVSLQGQHPASAQLGPGMVASHICKRPDRELCFWPQMEPGLGDKGHGYRDGSMRKPARTPYLGPQRLYKPRNQGVKPWGLTGDPHS